MKRLLLFTCVMLFGWLTTSAQCALDLQMQTNTTTSPYVVTFTDAASSGIATTYYWDFGDGTTDTSSTPTITHTYAQNGIYGPCVTAVMGPACTVIDCDTLWLQGTPNGCGAAFQYIMQPSLGGTAVAFSNYSSGSNPTFAWDFGDGNSSTAINPTHTYTTSGTFLACLTVSETNPNGVVTCTNTFCDSVRISPTGNNCSSFFTYTVTGNVGYFASGINSGTAPYSYSWDFGDNTSDNTASPTHTYTIAGNYTVCLTTVDANGCASTFCDSVVIGTTGGCNATYTSQVSGNTASFVSNTSGNAPYSYFWDFGDSTFSTLANPTHTYPAAPAGVSYTYNTCLTITDASGCSDTECAAVVITGGNTSCQGSYTWAQSQVNQDVQFTNTSGGPNGIVLSSSWDFGDSQTSTANSPNHFYANAGTYTVCLITSFQDQAIPTGPVCSDTVCQVITVNPVNAFCNAAFQYTTSITGGGIYVQFTNYSYGTQGISYLWDFGNGAGSTQENPSITLNSGVSTLVCLTITDGTGCTSTFCDTISTGPNTGGCNADFISSVSPLGNTVSFTDQSIGTNLAYAWDFGDGGRDFTANPSHTYNQPGTYTVCLTITEQVLVPGCTDSICYQIIVGGGNNCGNSFTYVTNMTGGPLNSATFTSTVTGTAPYTYQWDFGDNNTSNLANPTHAYAAAGSYYVCLLVTDAANCTSYFCDTVSFSINPSNCTAGFQQSPIAGAANSIQFYGYTGPVIGTLTANFTYDFGDGSSSNLFNPTHTYANPGLYLACVAVDFVDINTNQVVCSTTYCDSVVVGGPNTGNCYALFNFQQTSSLNTVAFYNQSTPSNTASGNTNLNYYWTFGNTGSSSATNPVHTFPGQGTYTVCLTIVDSSNGCSDQLCLPVTIGNNSYTLKGNVFKATGTPVGAIASGATVYLIISDSTSLYAIDSTYTSPNGYYEFTNVPLGLYLIKAALSPNDADYAAYLPTYYGDELFWYNAATVIAGPVLVTVSHDISLVAGSNAGGPGFVGGLISQGANKQGPGDPVAGIPVLLLNMDNTPVQYVYSDASGTFSFNNVAYGTYKVYAEVLGKPTEPAIVTIAPNNEEVMSVEIFVNSDKVTTGVTDIDVSVIEASGFYPNPVTHMGTLTFTLKESAELNISVINTLGQVVTERTQYFDFGQHSVSLDLQGRSQGIYIVLIEANGKPAVYQRILKQ